MSSDKLPRNDCLGLLRKAVGCLPLVATLNKARTKDHKEAASELIITLVISGIPIWLGSAIYIMARPSSFGWADIVTRNIGRGELFLTSSALLAPILYFMFKSERKFPHVMFLNLICILILIISAGAFGAIRMTSLVEVNPGWDDTLILMISFFVFVFACFVVYLSFVYKNWHETGAANLMQSGTESFFEEYMRRQQGSDEE